MLRRPVLALFLLFASYCFASPQTEAEKTIQAKSLAENVSFLAHPKMRGRGTLDSGYELPSAYLAKEMERLQLRPFGDGQKTNRSYLQEFSFTHLMVLPAKTRNVLGLLESKTKTEEIIIIGAHYDHLGINKKGEIYHGADDNASGVAAVLAIAQALKIYRERGGELKRSVLFAFWGAEELGLAGSRHFAKHLTEGVKLENIIAVINFDMIGRSQNNQLAVITNPEGRLLRQVCPELFIANELANKNSELKLIYQDPRFQQHFAFYRSDHYSFFLASPAGKKIPALFYNTGLHPDYHQPTDTPEKINYEALEKISKHAFRVLVEICNLPNRPKYQEP